MSISEALEEKQKQKQNPNQTKTQEITETITAFIVHSEVTGFAYGNDAFVFFL